MPSRKEETPPLWWGKIALSLQVFGGRGEKPKNSSFYTRSWGALFLCKFLDSGGNLKITLYYIKVKPRTRLSLGFFVSILNFEF